MNAHGDRPIVVGVTGGGENTSALRFAVDLWRRTGAGVRLIHAVPEVLLPIPGDFAVEGTYAQVGGHIVRHAEEELRSLAENGLDELEVELLVRVGHPSRVLFEASAEAQVVVVQHHERGLAGRLFSGSTAVGVATHARCPVVSVPDTWSDASPHERVTVGVDESGGPMSVVETAFEEAAHRKAVLHVVHAWRMAPEYDDIVAVHVGDTWQLRGEHHLQAAVEHVQSRYPQVKVEIDVLHEWPAEALVKASSVSDLLILGRRSRHAPLPFAFGSLPRTQIREAKCPVYVVPYPQHEHEAHNDLA